MTALLIRRGEGILVGASKTAALLLAVVYTTKWRMSPEAARPHLTKTAPAQGSPHAAETVPSARHGSQQDASPDPHGNAHYKTPQSHQRRHPFEAARPSPKGPPETSLKPGPSLRTPLPSRLLCPPPYSLSRNTAHARRQGPVTSDGRPAAPTTLKKSPGPRRAPAPRTGQPKGARRL